MEAPFRINLVSWGRVGVVGEVGKVAEGRRRGLEFACRPEVWALDAGRSTTFGGVVVGEGEE